jgi:hypothetical protein
MFRRDREAGVWLAVLATLVVLMIIGLVSMMCAAISGDVGYW